MKKELLSVALPTSIRLNLLFHLQAGKPLL